MNTYRRYRLFARGAASLLLLGFIAAGGWTVRELAKPRRAAAPGEAPAAVAPNPEPAEPELSLRIAHPGAAAPESPASSAPSSALPAAPEPAVDIAAFEEPADAFAALAPILREKGLTLGDAAGVELAHFAGPGPASHWPEEAFAVRASRGSGGEPAAEAENPAQRLRMRFTAAEGVAVAPEGFPLEMVAGPGATELPAHGEDWFVRWGGAGDAGTRDEALSSEGSRVEIAVEDGITEWFENGPDGVEHGFVIENPRRLGSSAAGTHSGFDNDPETLARTVRWMRGATSNACASFQISAMRLREDPNRLQAEPA